MALLAVTPVAASAEALPVAVSIAPLAWLAEQIGGEEVRVTTLVGPNDSPATYAPGPRELVALDEARVWLLAGVPFESVWTDRISADRPGLELVDLTRGLPSRPADGAHPGKGLVDPHRWTDPQIFARMGERMHGVLVRLSPANKTRFDERLAATRSLLETLASDIAVLLAPHRDRAFMTMHPSWGYFADAYGLEQIAIEAGGHEPGPRGLAGVIDRGREREVTVLLVQRQFSRRTATAVAGELNATVLEADPLSPDYARNLMHVASSLAEGFQ
jgi:zinc transport system substrate-binding protein